MKMKIRYTDTEGIQKKLIKVEAGALARRFKMRDIPAAVEMVEKKLRDLGIPAEAWKGTLIIIDPETVPHSHGRFHLKGTRCVIERGARGWFVREIYRAECGCTAKGGQREVSMFLSPLAYSRIPSRFTLS